jgi:hypothetical protein
MPQAVMLQPRQTPTPRADRMREQLRGHRLVDEHPARSEDTSDLGRCGLRLGDEEYNPTEIYEADRPAVTEALTAPGSKARNDRGQLSISKFKSIGRQIWPN